MIIRQEQSSDYTAVYQIVKSAFENAEYSIDTTMYFNRKKRAVQARP